MSTTSEFLNSNDDIDIVNAEVKDIKLSKEYIDEFGVSELDWKVLEGALHMNSTMTPYQCQHFVADSQLTPWRKTRQAMLELETRYHAYVEIKHSLKKSIVQRKLMQRDFEETEDEIKKELIEIDLSKLDYDITIWKRKYQQAQSEIDTFLKIAKKVIKTEDDIKNITEYNEDEERNYWIARMGKQAAMDIVSFGIITSGNMDSLTLMPEHYQVEALQIATRYSSMVMGGVDKINKQLQPELQKFMVGDKLTTKLIEDGGKS